jgi:CBS domain-containing protein
VDERVLSADELDEKLLVDHGRRREPVVRVQRTNALEGFSVTDGCLLTDGLEFVVGNCSPEQITDCHLCSVHGRRVYNSGRCSGSEKTDGTVAPTALGNLTSRYYLDLATAARFHGLVAGGGTDRDVVDDTDAGAGDLTTGDVLWAVAGAAEFDSVACRSDEADAVDAVLADGDATAQATDDAAADALTDGQRKVLAILRSGLDGHTPEALRGDAWAIRQNADRLLAALRAFGDRFADAEAANLVSRVAARLEDGVPESAVGLLAIDGVGATRARRLAEAGIESPAAVREAGVDTLQGIGLSPGVAEGVIEKAEALPAIEVEWDLPDAVAAGERDMREVTVRNVGGGARAGVALSVNGRPMTADETYLGECTLPVACFGADTDELELVVRLAFPELPLQPIESRATVRVDA